MLQIKTKLSKFKALCICSQCSQDYECNFYDAKKSRVGHLCDDCKDIIIKMKTFTQNDLLKVFHYDEHTGELTHKLDTRRSQKGSVATYPHNEGYLQMTIGGQEYLAHRVIWFMQTGQWPTQVDHENHDRADNRWCNLRDVKHRTNQLNMSLRRNNSTGVNGVRKLPSGRFNAYIMVQRKQIPLGTYDTLEEAASVRKQADQLYGFHLNHGS